MVELPPEILEHIFTSIQENRSQNYRDCSLVCSRWRSPAQRELFGIAAFTITRLDLVISSLDSFTYTTLVEDTYLCSLISSVPILRISLFGSSNFDPKFPEFLQLFSQVKKLSLSHDTKRLLFDECQFHSIKSSFIHLISLPTLTSISGHAHGLPAWLLPACTHLKELKWTDIPSQRRYLRRHPLHDEGYFSGGLTTMHLEGSGAKIVSFIAWLHKNAESMSASQVKNVTLCFRSNPLSWSYPFSLLCNVTNLTLRFNQSFGNDFEYDPKRLTNLESLRLGTWLETAESTDPYKAMARVFSWLRTFATFPLLELQTIQIQVFYNPQDKWDHSPLLLQAANLILERSTVMTHIDNHFPQLASFSVYAPWLKSRHAGKVFAVPQNVLPGAIFQCGQRPPGVEVASKTFGDRGSLWPQ
ncbi:hypothetical protein D9756_006492 [Leucocoprinus leucothites]|uniref:F-box domain-containing protein n=1 Tax=Leucocoprinus leucothites TaxID=201217 RepID=A0A8H5G2T2_9AGAR|nr:hypothetical protein D9756_006492 [Leucoagaricus leucothites]